ncbi:MAG: hypothetical protein GF334_04345 [Candidatus Altiarchaeales archaeon]|nr:hypothetical protein [Candidatus Altiarchaeales archaeon]
MDEDTRNKVKAAIYDADIIKLRELAGYFTDEAAINQEKQEILLAQITYCYNKIFSKIHLKDKAQELIQTTVKKIDEQKYESILKDIQEFDETHGLFHGGLVGKARIKIGSRLYSQGLSIGQAAELSDANVGDVQEYVGDTKYHEKMQGISLEERLRIARDILK